MTLTSLTRVRTIIGSVFVNGTVMYMVGECPSGNLCLPQQWSDKLVVTNSLAGGFVNFLAFLTTVGEGLKSAPTTKTVSEGTFY